MKRSKLRWITVITGLIVFICLVVYSVWRRRHQQTASAKDVFSPAEDTDYLDDLDAPELPDREEKAPARVRRGYIPISLGRD